MASTKRKDSKGYALKVGECLGLGWEDEDFEKVMDNLQGKIF